MDDKKRRVIEALFAQSDSSQFQSEKDAFLSKAMELCLKYGIEESELRKSTNPDEKPVVRSVTLYAPYRKAKQELLINVGMVHLCRVMQIGSDGRRVMLVGYQSDIDSALYIFESLKLQSISQMFKQCTSQDDFSRRFKSNFLMGYAFGVRRLLTSLEDSQPGLVLSGLSEVDKLVNDMTGGRSKERRFTPQSYSYSLGKSSGSVADVGLDRLNNTKLELEGSAKVRLSIGA